MNATRPTMRHVADMAGVSLKTVSRVINAEAGVTPATAERVTAAIAELGFERNDLAASLRHGRSSSTLGLVIEDVANPFYSAIAQAVEAAARDRGFLLITASLSACAVATGTVRTARAQAECQQQESDIDSTSTGSTTTSKVVCNGGQPGP